MNLEPVLVKIAVMTLVKGDTIVVSVDHLLTPEQRGKIKAELLSAVPVGVKPLVLERGMSLAAVLHSQGTDPDMD